jgi:hypothetical protein
MNWDDGTGGNVPLSRQASAQVPLGYESVSGDRWAPGIETVASRSTGATNNCSATVSPRIPPSLSRRVPDRALRKRRLCLKACVDELEAVRNATADAIQKANSLAEARSHLRALWDLLEGTPDSEAVEEMVNVLQIALCVESPEALAPRQLVAIHSVLAKMYDDPDFGDEAANDLTQELIEGGVDVFREIG